MTRRLRPHPYLATLGSRLGQPDVALGICPNELSRAGHPACATAAGVVPSTPAASPDPSQGTEAAEDPASRSSAVASLGASRAVPLPAAAGAPAGRAIGPGARSGADAAVAISEKALFLLTLIARHDGITPQAVLTRLITERGREIGLSPLLGQHFDDQSVLTRAPGLRPCAPDRASADADDARSGLRPAAGDQRETIVMRHHDIRTGTAAGEGDLADVPAFERTPGNRFRSGGP
jgi:hypothetical protein